MGTRSTTIFMDNDKELVRLYRQFDGYPDGHGVDLARACDKTIVNGIGPNMDANTHANGMGCLAAQAICVLKDGTIGNVYIAPLGEDNSWVDYIYWVSGKEGEKPYIECRHPDGTHVFGGSPQAWISKYDPESALAKKPRRKKAA